MRFFLLIIVSSLFFLSGCSNEVQTIPVQEAWRQPLDSSITYIVKPGDTLYSVAWFYGLDYRQVAEANNISAPYAIKTGQKLLLGTPKKKTKVTQISAKPIVTKAVIEQQPAVQEVEPLPASTKITAVKTVQIAGLNWAWPAQGKVIHNYCAAKLNKGIDITAKYGSPITAAANGKVVYVGNGLRGYGELIIIKHNDEFLSAYAHNKKVLVSEGQTVQIGQVIALMGKSEAKCVMVHFEIRKAGKPVNPNQYLPKLP